MLDVRKCWGGGVTGSRGLQNFFLPVVDLCLDAEIRIGVMALQASNGCESWKPGFKTQTFSSETAKDFVCRRWNSCQDSSFRTLLYL